MKLYISKQDSIYWDCHACCVVQKIAKLQPTRSAVQQTATLLTILYDYAYI